MAAKGDPIVRARGKVEIALLAWKRAMLDAHCSCGRRVGRTKPEIDLLDALAQLEEALQARRWVAEAPTVPRGRRLPPK